MASYATQQWAVEVEDDACLVVLPGPAIPFRGSRYFQRGRVDLAPRARLIWGDIWLPGRYDRGELSERFQFERIVQDFEARRAGRLVYRDRFRWDGPWTAQTTPTGTWAGPWPPPACSSPGRCPRLFPRPAPACGARSSGSTPARAACDGAATRPAVTADLVQTALRLAGNWTGGPDARPWLLASSDLAPNHWFSTPSEKPSGPHDRASELDQEADSAGQLAAIGVAPLTPKAGAPAKSPRISGRISRHLIGCQLSPRVTSA